MTEIGKTLRDLRMKKGYSLTKMTVLTNGISGAYLSTIENGHYIPAPDKLRAIAKALDVSYLELMRIAGYITTDDIQEIASSSNLGFLMVNDVAEFLRAAN